MDLRFWILDWRSEGTERYSSSSSRCLFGNRKSKIQKRPRGLKWAVVLTVLIMISSAASAAEPIKWKEEWQRVVEAAKKEGQVALYGGQEITHPDIVAAFNKEFPFIRVLSVAGRAADLLCGGYERVLGYDVDPRIVLAAIGDASDW